MTVREMIIRLLKEDLDSEVLVTGSGLCKPAGVGLLNGRKDQVLIGPARS